MPIKYLFLVITFFTFFLTTNAQSLTKSKQDSLLVIWKDTAQQDTIRLRAISKVVKEGFRFKNPDSAFYYAQLQYDFANSIENKEFQALALNVQGDSYLLKGDPDKAFETLSLALKLSEELPDKKIKISTLGNLSRVFQTRGDFETALEYNLRILKLSEEIQDQASIGKSLSDIGTNYIKKGDYPKGLEYLSRSKKIFDALGNKYNVVTVQSYMAQIYLQQGELDKAKELVLLNLAYFEETNNQILISGTLSNLGGIYAQQGNNKKALEYLERAMVFIEESGNIPYIAGLSQNIGFIYYDEGELERALEYLNKSLKLSKDIKNEEYIVGAKQKIGVILAEQGKYNQAIPYGNDALIFYQNTGDVEGISNTSKSLVKSYKATDNYKKAFEMNELYFQMRDSLNSAENQKAIIELQVQSDYEKQKAIDDLENEKEIAIETQKTKAQRNISIAIGVVLLLISLLAYVIFNRLKITRQQKTIIEEQKKKVEQSEKYKEQFLANMSHEIRTPMHAISGMIKILDRNEHPPAQDVYLKAMQTSSENLVVILNDVLDLSKIEAGKLEVEQIPMNPEAVMVNVVQLLKFKAEEKGLQLSYEVAADVPKFVIGDPTRLNQILLNLAGNAIKFTEKGKVAISLTLENQQLRFAIKDTGIGIATDKIEHIFKAFEQAKGSTSRFYGGTGLGLSISKQLVELQQGKIRAESNLGQGSTFYVSLPLSIASADLGQAIISEEKLKTMMKSLKAIRILIAEDNPFNQMIAQDDLSFYIDDVVIETVENGALAIEKFKTSSYDLILMDVQMPEMNGFEATKKIREIESTQKRETSIPIIAMTASLLKTEIDSCYNAGMNNYIPKPYKLEELIVPIFKELRS
jgi:signal transduction histidine kinase/ActR/RegA family two-component response regulator